MLLLGWLIHAFLIFHQKRELTPALFYLKRSKTSCHETLYPHRSGVALGGVDVKTNTIIIPMILKMKTVYRMTRCINGTLYTHKDIKDEVMKSISHPKGTAPTTTITIARTTTVVHRAAGKGQRSHRGKRSKVTQRGKREGGALPQVHWQEYFLRVSSTLLV